MNSKFLIWLLITIFLTTVPPAAAQHPKKVPRVRSLSTGSPFSAPARIEAFRHGLRELGYVEGKLDRLPALAAELIGSRWRLIT